MTFSWDRNLAGGGQYSRGSWPETPWLEFMEPFAHCPSPSLASRCNQKICGCNINPKYFTFNCWKRRGWDGKMGRWACRGLHMRRGGEFMEGESEQKMRCMNMEARKNWRRAWSRWRRHTRKVEGWLLETFNLTQSSTFSEKLLLGVFNLEKIQTFPWFFWSFPGRRSREERRKLFSSWKGNLTWNWLAWPDTLMCADCMTGILFTRRHWDRQRIKWTFTCASQTVE